MRVKLLNGLNNEELIRVCTSAGLLSRAEGKVLNVLEDVQNKEIESVKKILNRIIGMGHTSIVDHDYLVFALEDVPVVIEQLIISSRFSSFTIKSRREADFAKDGFYTPEFKDENGNLINNQEEVKQIYNSHMESLFQDYTKLVETGIKKEDARYILPYSFSSQMIFGMSATELSKTINKLTNGKWANIDVVKQFGLLLKQEALNRADYIETILSKWKFQLTSPIDNVLDEIIMPHIETAGHSAILDKAVLMEHTENIDKSIIINTLMRKFQYTYLECEKIYNEHFKGNNENIKKIFNAIKDDINKIDVNNIHIKVQMPISYANLTHITRHRTTVLSIPDFVDSINFDYREKPKLITENAEASQIFDNAYLRTKQVYDQLRNIGIRKEDLVFFVLSGNKVNIVTLFDGETLRHISSVRVCNKAQWEIRRLITQIVENVKSIAPNYYNMIGANCEVLGYCPEGKECCGKIKPRKI